MMKGWTQQKKENIPKIQEIARRLKRNKEEIKVNMLL